MAVLQEYLLRFGAECLPGAPEITDAEVAHAIAEVRAEHFARLALQPDSVH